MIDKVNTGIIAMRDNMVFDVLLLGKRNCTQRPRRKSYKCIVLDVSDLLFGLVLLSFVSNTVG